jgi:D-methionine transport system permease protein
MVKIIVPAIFATLRMLAASVTLGTFFGFILAMILTLTDKNGLHPNRWIFAVLDFFVNTIRSFPFIILMVAIVPFTKLVAGTSMGETAAIVPLTIAATPFIARIIDNSMKEVDRQLVEAARSFGASNMQILLRVILVEAVPSIISGLVLAIVSVLGATAMAGVIGAGGLGAVGLTYGYQNFNNMIMFITVMILIILVQLIQMTGDFIYKKSK